MYRLSRIGECLVLRIELRIFLTRNRIVRISLRLGKLVYDARLRMLLSREIFELRDTRVELLVRIIYDRGVLVNRLIMCLMFEFERPVRQLAITIVEICIHRAGINHFAKRDFLFNFAVIAIQHDLDV